MPASDLQHFITQLEADSSLREPDQLRRRLDALDALDAYFGEADENTRAEGPHIVAIHNRAMAIRNQLEAANSALYRAIRSEIQLGARPDALHQTLENLTGRNENGSPLPGLSYDYQDELISGVLALRDPGRENAAAEPEMVFYQPTPARHILRLLAVSALSPADVLVDLGSGLGHVPLLASILTGVRSHGIEVEPAYVACARECTVNLHLDRVTFLQQDARTADLFTGNVFYLYTPFTGAMLAQVLEKLRSESASRPIRICTLGPCTSLVVAQPWLRPATPPNPDQITLFHSRP
jgi:hypothetical protein